MAVKSNIANTNLDIQSQCTYVSLAEQLRWLIRLRWIAVSGIILAVLLGTYLFGVLPHPLPLILCSVILLICNTFYFVAANKNTESAKPKDLIFAMIQVEVDLIILTAVLVFSGGVVNPFFLFYVFHVIIAAIILPRNLSFFVGLTAILLFGLLEINELSSGALLGYYPLEFSNTGDLWRNPVYALAAFAAFSCTVILAQYLTRMIVTRMATKELEAARSSDVLTAIINAMSEGLIFVTDEGKVTICNPAARLWQATRESKDSSALEDFPRPLSDVLNDLVSSSSKTQTWEGSFAFETSSPETRYIEAKGCPVIGIDGKKLGHVIVGQDLTDHKKLETDLRERTREVTRINEILRMSRLEMAQREKMVAIGQMATGIAHEIGNPLASISSVAQYLTRKRVTREQKEHLLIIQKHVQRISNILRRMLSLSRPAKSEYRWTDINELIDDTLSLIAFDKRARSATIKNITNPDLPNVWLNPQNFEQVLLNIFINALDAMNAKQTEQEHLLQIKREFRDGMVEIRISDTGIGMNPEVCRNAFESFFTTKEIGKGTGLGLYISKNLISEIDGTVTLESELGKGTTVLIRISPRSKEEFTDKNDTKDGFLKRAEAI